MPKIENIVYYIGTKNEVENIYIGTKNEGKKRGLKLRGLMFLLLDSRNISNYLSHFIFVSQYVVGAPTPFHILLSADYYFVVR